MLYELAVIASQRQQDAPQSMLSPYLLQQDNSVYDLLIQSQTPAMENFFANSFEAELNSFLHDSESLTYTSNPVYDGSPPAGSL